MGEGGGNGGGHRVKGIGLWGRGRRAGSENTAIRPTDCPHLLD